MSTIVIVIHVLIYHSRKYMYLIITLVNIQIFKQAIKHILQNHCPRSKLLKLKLPLNTKTSRSF
jgi:hypothetical protein